MDEIPHVDARMLLIAYCSSKRAQLLRPARRCCNLSSSLSWSASAVAERGDFGEFAGDELAEHLVDLLVRLLLHVLAAIVQNIFQQLVHGLSGGHPTLGHLAHGGHHLWHAHQTLHALNHLRGLLQGAAHFGHGHLLLHVQLHRVDVGFGSVHPVLTLAAVDHLSLHITITTKQGRATTTELSCIGHFKSLAIKRQRSS